MCSREKFPSGQEGGWQSQDSHAGLLGVGHLLPFVLTRGHQSVSRAVPMLSTWRRCCSAAAQNHIPAVAPRRDRKITKSKWDMADISEVQREMSLQFD